MPLAMTSGGEGESERGGVDVVEQIISHVQPPVTATVFVHSPRGVLLIVCLVCLCFTQALILL